jgi:hypothetical protein
MENYGSYPPRIKMSGLPLCLSGWNAVFVKTEKISCGCPVYTLDSYNMYNIVPIIGGTIFKRGDEWVFVRNCDDISDSLTYLYKNDANDTPLGKWSYGGIVTKEETWEEWFLSFFL